ncbi:hypothetical protein EYF80_026097 [Liparis tanakae]|uniref:Uncharacterized protein n=1 Tax=Liparis tanakae TaxID=230148 RepID=A0A4Z2HCW9_9TELE|nr:hypothetical protein EYF80_026097 [Liparis tanakae]
MVMKDQHPCKQELISMTKRTGFWTLPVRVVGLKDKRGPLGTKGICDRRGKARCTGPQLMLTTEQQRVDYMCTSCCETSVDTVVTRVRSQL